MRKLLWSAISFGVLLTACATPSTKRIQVNPDLAVQEAKKQQEVAFQVYLEEYKRVQGIGFKIKRHSTSLCSDKTRFSIGVLLVNKYFLREHFQEAAETLLNLSENPQVLEVLPDSGAARSGIKLGDIILEVNGEKASASQSGFARIT